MLIIRFGRPIVNPELWDAPGAAYALQILVSVTYGLSVPKFGRWRMPRVFEARTRRDKEAQNCGGNLTGSSRNSFFCTNSFYRGI